MKLRSFVFVFVLTLLVPAILFTVAVSGQTQPSGADEVFIPLTPGSFWVYRGTVRWFDFEVGKAVTTKVSLKMQIEKVIRKPEFSLAVISGFPSNLDWTDGHANSDHYVLIETARHEVFLDTVPPDFDYSAFEKPSPSLDQFLAEDNLLFRWPLRKGIKFGDADVVRRPDDRYCWVVATCQSKVLNKIKGVPSATKEVFLLQYVTNPEDTQMELAAGLGILSYQYHHHGSVADTSLTLVEFHTGQKVPEVSGVSR